MRMNAVAVNEIEVAVTVLHSCGKGRVRRVHSWARAIRSLPGIFELHSVGKENSIYLGIVCGKLMIRLLIERAPL